jgi:hypothetical protein
MRVDAKRERQEWGTGSELTALVAVIVVSAVLARHLLRALLRDLLFGPRLQVATDVHDESRVV